MCTTNTTSAINYWALMEKNYDFVLCFSISTGNILRKAGFETTCTILDSYDNYYDLIEAYKQSYVSEHSIDEFSRKTRLDYLITHQKVNFVGLENIENNQERWYEYTLIVDGDYGALFIQDIHDLHCRMLELEHLSSTDYLTSLYNRSTFNNMTDQLISNNKEFALLLIDVDDFKFINDHYGHNIGDNVLIEISQLLKHHLPSGAIISRYGGDEFIACIKDITTIEQIKDSLEQLMCKMKARLKCDVDASISIGVSFYPQNGIERKSLIHSADKALYKAKKEGKNTYRFSI